MSFTIVAKTFKSPRIKPLLLSLSLFKPSKDYKLIVLTREDTYENILNELNYYRSSIKWTLLKEDLEGDDWWEFVKTKEVLTLPTSSIPFKDSINKLIDTKNIGSYPICKEPSANFALISDEYSSYITEKIFDECLDIPSSIYYTKDFNNGNFKDNEIFDDIEVKDSKFVITDPFPTIYHKVKLINSNVDNIKPTTN